MKTIIQYIILVGVPLLGVLVILRLGSHLQAPASVGGSWILQIEPRDGSAAACPEYPEWLLPPVMLVSQSGSDLVIKLNDSQKSVFSGKLHELTITGSEKPTSNPTAPVFLVAAVDRSVEPDTLEGYFATPTCTSRLPVTGVRQPHAVNITGEH